MSAKYFAKLQEFDKVKYSGQLSEHPIYHGFINRLKFAEPSDCSAAQFVLVMAIFTLLRLMNFKYNEDQHELKISLMPQFAC
jgi:hypothetical protein